MENHPRPSQAQRPSLQTYPVRRSRENQRRRVETVLRNVLQKMCRPFLLRPRQNNQRRTGRTN